MGRGSCTIETSQRRRQTKHKARMKRIADEKRKARREAKQARS